MRILIVKLSALGDIIHALPVLDYLRQAVPDVVIDWVVEEQNRTILEGNPLIRNVISINTRAWRKKSFSQASRREVMAIVRQLRSASYDVVLDLQGNIKSGIITALTGAPKRYGFDRNGVRESLNLFCTNRHVPLGPEDHHISNRSLKIVSSAFGGDYASYTLASHIQTNAEDDHAAEKLLAATPGNKHVLFHTGTTWETKKWTTECWLELGRLVLNRFLDVCILLSWGNEQEYDEAGKLAAELGTRALLLPRLQLKSFCAVLKKVDLAVGGDTGPIHMAAAVGTPTVSFYRATDAKRNGPQGPRHIILQSDMPCARCLNRSCRDDIICRHSIRTTDMFEAIESILVSNRKST
ncbi:MAG: lipopolysaccharide heptosyltransferase I [Desulfuromonadaceae bacterium]|nr:lipopolysaccharide heptosyltransferase I [Desulfuromonadaceae bacterium]